MNKKDDIIKTDYYYPDKEVYYENIDRNWE